MSTIDESADLTIDRRGAWSLGLLLLAGILISAFRGQWKLCAALIAGEIILTGTTTVVDTEGGVRPATTSRNKNPSR